MPKSQPLFSIIINNYNYTQYLRATIDSALAQTYENIEVIVVDDGSTDDSVQVLRSYADRIIAVEKKNGGQASAVNSGYEHSSGELMIFLDSDDLLTPYICAEIVKHYLQKAGTAKFQFRLQVIDSEGNPTGGILPPMRIKMPQGDIRKLITRQRSYTHPPTSGNAFTRKHIENLMPIPEETYRKGAAAFLVYNTILAGGIVSIEKIGGRYRIHGSNITASNPYMDGEKLKAHLEEEICERMKQIEILKQSSNIIAPVIGISDLTNIKSRVILKKLYPEEYIYGHSLLNLCARGCLAAFLYSESRLIDRPIWCVWFILMFFVPVSTARNLVTQVTDHNKRAGIIEKILGNRRRN